jgi:hypothetical protein
MTISARDARLAGVSWRKSRHSNSQGTCVELARLAGGEIAMRNSRFPDGPVQVYSRADIRALIEAVKAGGLDQFSEI